MSRMGESDNAPKLRMAPRETAEDLAHRVEREQRAVNVQREAALSESLAPFRVGSVPYLNGVPLTRGLEEEIIYAVPSKLAEMLRRDDLDAALVSLAEVLLTDRYDILDGIAIASLGEVQSVLLTHRKPLEEARVIHCDTASITSVKLMQVLLAERGLMPELQPLAGYDFASLPDYALLIGDVALDFFQTHDDQEFWDLGTAWYEMTQLPFVYAVWALRRGVENSSLRRQLREARDFGLDTLDTIVKNHPEYDYEFITDYLGWHIHYHLGADERRGIAKFVELLQNHGFGPVYDPKFVA